MRSNMYSAAALALAGLASAQTHSLCNPIKGDKCPPNPACPDFTHEFTGENGLIGPMAGTTPKYGPDGLTLTIEKFTDAPTMASSCYIFFGELHFWLKTAHGTGIVTSVVLQSDDLDEIDWEWTGTKLGQVQTNYFSKGDDSTYDRGGNSDVADHQTTFHKYSLVWTNSSLTWKINDGTVRVLNYGDAKGGATYPQTPMQIRFGTWIGGRPGAPQGTIDWAGGLTNLAEGPFVANYQKIQVINYSNGRAGAGSYTYSDQSGTMGSIAISSDGAPAVANNAPKKDTPSSSSSSSATSSSSSSASSTLTTTTTSSASKTTTTTAATTAAAQTTSAPKATSTPNAAGRLAPGVAVLGAAALALAL